MIVDLSADTRQIFVASEILYNSDFFLPCVFHGSGILDLDRSHSRSLQFKTDGTL